MAETQSTEIASETGVRMTGSDRILRSGWVNLTCLFLEIAGGETEARVDPVAGTVCGIATQFFRQ